RTAARIAFANLRSGGGKSAVGPVFTARTERLKKKNLVLLRQQGHTQCMRTALITGASRGLGRALARALSERGWRLVIDARGVTELEAVADELRDRTDVVALPGDVSDETHRRALIDAAGGGRFDLLVNNASLLGPSPQPTLA